MPSPLDWTETRVTPCACPILPCTVWLQLCTICICTDAGRIRHTHWQIGRLGEVCDVSIVSPKFRCRPETARHSAGRSSLLQTTPKTRGMRPRGAHMYTTLLNWRCRIDVRACAASWIGLDWPCRWVRLFRFPSRGFQQSRRLHHAIGLRLAWPAIPPLGPRTRYLSKGIHSLQSGSAVLDALSSGFPFDPADQNVSGDVYDSVAIAIPEG